MDSTAYYCSPFELQSYFKTEGHNAAVPAYSRGTLLIVLQHWNAMLQTWHMIQCSDTRLSYL